MRRDQLCPCSNKGGCFILHPLFARCKPNPFNLGYCTPQAIFSSRCFYKIDVQLPLNQSPNDTNDAIIPSGGRKSGYVWFEHFLQLQVSKPHLGEWSTMASRLFEGIGFVSPKERMPYETFSFFQKKTLTKFYM